MARQPLLLHDLYFHSQREARAYFRALLHRYRDGETIGGEDAERLRALLERHPGAAQKIGPGIRRFYTAKTRHPTRCFWVERVDGTGTEFSYQKALRGKHPSLEQAFLEACRQAVAEDLQRAKRQFFAAHGDADGTVACELTGARLAFHDAHLDHQAPLTFEVLATAFRAAEGLELTPALFWRHRDGQVQTEFRDPEMKARFRRYHGAAARLRLPKVRENLRLGGAMRLRRPQRPVRLPKA